MTSVRIGKRGATREKDAVQLAEAYVNRVRLLGPNPSPDDQKKLFADKQVVLDAINKFVNTRVEGLIKLPALVTGFDKPDEKLPPSDQVLADIIKNLDNGTNPEQMELVVNNLRVGRGTTPLHAWDSKLTLLVWAAYNDYLKTQLKKPPGAPEVPPLNLVVKTGHTTVSIPPLK